jgi:hypothetical protein
MRQFRLCLSEFVATGENYIIQIVCTYNLYASIRNRLPLKATSDNLYSRDRRKDMKALLRKLR